MVENEPIDLSKVVIARRWSYLEWNMHRGNFTLQEFIKNQQSLGIKTDAMVNSHFEQLASLEKILGLFGEKPKVLVGETLTKKLFKDASLIISLGGDDHLKYVSHFIDNQLVLAINSDYERSEGGMISYLPVDFKKLLLKLEGGDYEIEEWPRLQATLLRVNRKPLKIKELAISEIYIGTWARISMSKYNLGLPRHKDSGMLIALPAGIGEASWFNCAGGNFPEEQTFSSRSEKVAWYLSTEIWRGRTLPSTDRIKKIYPGEQLEINYTAYYDGILSVDPKEKSGRNYKMLMRDKAIIEFADKTLKVIK